MAESDTDITVLLTQVKLALDVLASAYAVWFLFDMANRGQLSYYLNWHYEQWKKKRKAERRLQFEARMTVLHAERILREAVQNG